MKILLALVSLLHIVSCAKNPSNSQGINFDFNSMYCIELRREINKYPLEVTKVKGVDEKLYEKNTLSGITQARQDRERLMLVYEKECESHTAFQTRLKEDEIKIEKQESAP